MKPQSKLDGILRGTRQARTQEPGLQHFSVIEKPAEKPELEKRDWWFLFYTLGVVGLIAGVFAANYFGWQ